MEDVRAYMRSEDPAAHFPDLSRAGREIRAIDYFGADVPMKQVREARRELQRALVHMTFAAIVAMNPRGNVFQRPAQWVANARTIGEEAFKRSSDLFIIMGPFNPATGTYDINEPLATIVWDAVLQEAGGR